MSAQRTLFALAVLGCGVFLASAGEELSRVWSDRSATVRQRADTVNRVFTNGTPVSVVVAALGTNYTLCGSSARVWVGSGPEPPNTFWLSYRFGDDEVTIGTSAVFGRDLDPLACKFTGAGYSLPVSHSTQTTNRIPNGQQGAAANGSQPFSSETNRTSSAAGSRR
jgi:hypothetical protein